MREPATGVRGSIVAQVQQFLISSTEFDLLFTTLLLVLLDEIPEPPKDKLLLVAEMSSKKIADFEVSFETLEALSSDYPSPEEMPRENLFRLAGIVSNEETEQILAAIEENCERIDAEW